MQQRWGLPVIAWPSRLRPNYWDLVALPLVLGGVLVIIGTLILSGLDKRVEELLVDLSPPWLTELTTRF